MQKSSMFCDLEPRLSPPPTPEAIATHNARMLALIAQWPSYGLNPMLACHDSKHPSFLKADRPGRNPNTLTDIKKSPPWRRHSFGEVPITEAEAQSYMRHAWYSHAYDIGVYTGLASTKTVNQQPHVLHVFDIELHEIYDAFKEWMQENWYGDIWDTFYIERCHPDTKNGAHIPVWIPSTLHTTTKTHAKLAMRPNGETDKDGNPCHDTLAEILHGLYCVMAPSRGYVIEQGDPAHIPRVDQETYYAMLDTLRLMDERPAETTAAHPCSRRESLGAEKRFVPSSVETGKREKENPIALGTKNPQNRVPSATAADKEFYAAPIAYHYEKHSSVLSMLAFLGLDHIKPRPPMQYDAETSELKPDHPRLTLMPPTSACPYYEVYDHHDKRMWTLPEIYRQHLSGAKLATLKGPSQTTLSGYLLVDSGLTPLPYVPLPEFPEHALETYTPYADDQDANARAHADIRIVYKAYCKNLRIRRFTREENDPQPWTWDYFQSVTPAAHDWTEHRIKKAFGWLIKNCVIAAKGTHHRYGRRPTTLWSFGDKALQQQCLERQDHTVDTRNHVNLAKVESVRQTLFHEALLSDTSPIETVLAAQEPQDMDHCEHGVHLFEDCEACKQKEDTDQLYGVGAGG